MRKQIILLGLVLLCLGYNAAYPIENIITVQLIRALREEIRESGLLNESELPQTGPENTDIMYPIGEGGDFSSEKSACINLGNDGCVNGSIVGSGGDGGFLGGAGNPGK